MSTAAWKSWDAPAEGATLYDWTDGRCSLCDASLKRLVLDHCHETGLVRGYLCHGCNSLEASSSAPMFEEWRSGDHPARALRHFEVYTNQFRATPIRPGSALDYYTHDEQEAWWAQVAETLATDGIFPSEAPWSEEATARREAEYEQFRIAMTTSPIGRRIHKALEAFA